MIGQTYRPWTAQEDAIALHLSDEGVPHYLIGLEVGRSGESVKKRLQALRRIRGEPVRSSWSMEQIETVRRMWGEGFSCSQIGEAIGKSRNAVIGKIHRLQLDGRKGHRAPHVPPVKKAKVDPPRMGNRRKSLIPKATVAAASGLKPLPMPKLVKPVLAAPMGAGVPLVDMTGCKYPVAETEGIQGRHLFCNEAIEGQGSYCAYHDALCHTKPSKPGEAKRFRQPITWLRAVA